MLTSQNLSGNDTSLARDPATLQLLLSSHPNWRLLEASNFKTTEADKLFTRPPRNWPGTWNEPTMTAYIYLKKPKPPFLQLGAEENICCQRRKYMLSKENICPLTSLGELLCSTNPSGTCPTYTQVQGQPSNTRAAGRPAGRLSLLRSIPCAAVQSWNLQSLLQSLTRAKTLLLCNSYDDKAVVQPRLNGQYK